MCKCAYCNRVFDEPRLTKVYVEEAWGHAVYETVGVCPRCGEDDIDWDYEEEEEEEEE